MKRYNFYGEDSYEMEHPRGDFVEYEDAARIIAQRDRLAEASKKFLNKYIDFIDSGDAGNWDPRTEPEVIALHAALTELDKEKQS